MNHHAPQRQLDGRPVARTERPRVFIVTATYNSAKTIEQTLVSVLDEIEFVDAHMIIDGGSKDDTLAIVARYRDRYGDRLTVVSEPDDGIYDAMNKGVRLALGSARDCDLVATLNSDDYYEAGALRTMTSMAELHPAIDVFYGDVRIMDADGVPTGVLRRSAATLTRDSACDVMPIEHPSMFVRGRCYRRIGFYDTTYSIAGDYEFVLRLIEGQVPSMHVGAVITRFRAGGVSDTYETASLKECIRARSAHGSPPVREWAVYYRRWLVGRIFRLVRWIPGMPALQRRFSSGRDRPMGPRSE